VGAGKMEFGGVRPLECRPPARSRRAALEDGGTDGRLRSDGTPSENAWRGRSPRRRAGTETEMGAGYCRLRRRAR